MDNLQTSEPFIRLGLFVGVFLVIATLETALPRRDRTQPLSRRWVNNLSISTLNQLLMRLILPITAIGVAEVAANRDWGLFGLTQLDFAIEFAAAIVLLDLAIYLQHRAFHRVPILWRLHRVHHADTQFDVTTGVRFHPVSILISTVIKLTAVALLGAPVVAVLAFEVLLNATSLFNHSNISISTTIDRWLRMIVVTPDMHRVHHSSSQLEHNRNFGFNFPWWDRLLGSYHPQPANGHEGMQIGLSTFRNETDQRIDKLLLQPWADDTPDSNTE